jgi:hypothetical protein
LARFTIRATSGSARLPEVFLLNVRFDSMIESSPHFVAQANRAIENALSPI